MKIEKKKIRYDDNDELRDGGGGDASDIQIANYPLPARHIFLSVSSFTAFITRFILIHIILIALVVIFVVVVLDVVAYFFFVIRRRRFMSCACDFLFILFYLFI